MTLDESILEEESDMMKGWGLRGPNVECNLPKLVDAVIRRIRSHVVSRIGECGCFVTWHLYRRLPNSLDSYLNKIYMFDGQKGVRSIIFHTINCRG